MLAALEAGGLSASVVDGVCDKPRYRGCSKAHLAALRNFQGQEPFLILEDDVLLTEDFRLDVDLPADCQILYLGHSIYGTDHKLGGLGPHSDLTETAGEGHLRVHSMLAAHAILYVDPEAVEQVARSIENSISDANLRRHDIGLCELQQELWVYATDRPYFAQNEEVQGQAKKDMRREQRDIICHSRNEGEQGAFGDVSGNTHVVTCTELGNLQWQPIAMDQVASTGILGFFGPEIFEAADNLDRSRDLQGWNSKHQLFEKMFRAVRPSTVIEVGVWKGASVIHMADLAKQLDLPCRIIAIDTWLGSSEHWLSDEMRADLKLRNGYPTLFETFLVNVRNAGFEDIIEPLPVPATTAAEILSARGVAADIIHIDAGHEYEDVWADLTSYAPLLTERGVIIGDDYTRSYEGVRRAFNRFCRRNGMTLQKIGRKCVCARHEVFAEIIAPVL